MQIDSIQIVSVKNTLKNKKGYILVYGIANIQEIK